MSLFPEVQRKAQAEIDRVVGPNRLVDFNDFDDLVYCQAIVLESIRWNVVLPVGVPHQVIRDDEFKGYRIPKGTTIIPVRFPQSPLFSSTNSPILSIFRTSGMPESCL